MDLLSELESLAKFRFRWRKRHLKRLAIVPGIGETLTIVGGQLGTRTGISRMVTIRTSVCVGNRSNIRRADAPPLHNDHVGDLFLEFIRGQNRHLYPSGSQLGWGVLLVFQDECRHPADQVSAAFRLGPDRVLFLPRSDGSLVAVGYLEANRNLWRCTHAWRHSDVPCASSTFSLTHTLGHTHGQSFSSCYS